MASNLGVHGCFCKFCLEANIELLHREPSGFTMPRPMTPIEELLALDDLLTRLAAARTAAANADNVPEAERLDSQWQDTDEQRQRLRARMSDRDLIEYEVASQAEKSHPDPLVIALCSHGRNGGNSLRRANRTYKSNG